jgi:hypothetical protein
MSFDVKIEHKKSFILATFSGDFDLEDALEKFNEILEAASEKNVSKILIDHRKISSQKSFIDEATYAEETTKSWLDFIFSSKNKYPKLAYVAQQILDVDKFGILVAKNRGGFNFDIFEDIKKAEEWLHTDDV